MFVCENGSKGMVETPPHMCLFQYNKWVSGLLELVWPYHLSGAFFLLATKSHVGKGAPLLQMRSRCTKSHDDTIG